jgi:hypothetical protein
MTTAGVSPTSVAPSRAITRTGQHCRVQPDITFRREFCVFYHFTNLSQPPRFMQNTLVSMFRERIFAFLHLLAGLQCP